MGDRQTERERDVEGEWETDCGGGVGRTQRKKRSSKMREIRLESKRLLQNLYIDKNLAFGLFLMHLFLQYNEKFAVKLLFRIQYLQMPPPPPFFHFLPVSVRLYVCLCVRVSLSLRLSISVCLSHHYFRQQIGEFLDRWLEVHFCSTLPKLKDSSYLQYCTHQPCEVERQVYPSLGPVERVIELVTPQHAGGGIAECT